MSTTCGGTRLFLVGCELKLENVWVGELEGRRTTGDLSDGARCF